MPDASRRRLPELEVGLVLTGTGPDARDSNASDANGPAVTLALLDGVGEGGWPQRPGAVRLGAFPRWSQRERCHG